MSAQVPSDGASSDEVLGLADLLEPRDAKGKSAGKPGPKVGPPKVGPQRVAPPKVGPRKVGPPNVGPPSAKLGPPIAPKLRPPPAIKPPPVATPARPKPVVTPAAASTAGPSHRRSTMLGVAPPPSPPRPAVTPRLDPPPVRGETVVGPAPTGPLPVEARRTILHVPSAPSGADPPDDDGERTVMRGAASSDPIDIEVDDDDDSERTVMRPGTGAYPAVDDEERTTMHTPIADGVPQPVYPSSSGPIAPAIPPGNDESTFIAAPASASAPPINVADPDDGDKTTMRSFGAPVVDEDEMTRMRGSSELSIHPDESATELHGADVTSQGASPSREISLVEDPQATHAPPRASPLADNELPKGTVVGRYVVVERIGTGGMGSVYAAYDPELDRKVAVKVLHSVISGKSSQAAARGRLLREAQALAKLSHPAVITVHDVGVFREQVFMAMEFVDGITLKQWVKDNKPNWREAVRVFMKAGEGLAAAHAAELIHRDFKPTNVLISDSGRVRVLDFGLARRSEHGSGSGSVDEGDSSSSSGIKLKQREWQQALADCDLSLSVSGSSLDLNLTQAGAIMGSPGYMAPEQHMSRPTDPRTDQFSFCVALYEALYGARPFISEDARMLIYAIMESRMHKPPRDSKVPSWLRKVVLKGLSADPNERYPTMQELLAQLSRDPGRKVRRVLMIFGGLVVLGGIGTVAAWPYLDPPEITADATARIEELVDAAHEAGAKALFVYPPPNSPETPTAFSKIGELEAIDDETRKLALERALELRQEFAATLVGIGDRYWQQEGGKAFAIDYYAQALMFDDTNAHASKRASLTVGQLAALRDKAAKAEFSEGELEAAESLAVLADEDEERKKQKLAEMLADAQAEGRSLTGQAQLKQIAGDATPEPKKKKKRPPAAKPVPDVPEVDFDADAKDEQPSESNRKSKRDPAAAKELAKQGRAKLNATQWQEAEKLFHQALALDRRCASALIGLSDLHFDRSEYNMAATYAERAVAAAPKSSSYRIKLGDVYYKVLRYAEAKKAYEAAAELGSAAAASRLDKIKAKLGG